MIEPDSLLGERVRWLFHHAQDLIRKQGIATLHGVQETVGLITIHITMWPPQSDESRNQYAAAARKWFPYRLEIWQRQQVMLSVSYNGTRELKSRPSSEGCGKIACRYLERGLNLWAVRTNRNHPVNEVWERPRHQPIARV